MGIDLCAGWGIMGYYRGYMLMSGIMLAVLGGIGFIVSRMPVTDN